MRNIWALAIFVVMAFCPVAIASPSQPAAHPGTSWQTVPPAKVGLSASKLEQIAQTARVGNSNCLVVVRYGKIAGEWYFRGTGPASTQNIWSATKSITSTLVGIAQDHGDLRIGESASRWITEWKRTPSRAVTVRDILSNDSGRAWSLGIDYGQLLRAPDRTAFAIGLPQAEPPGQLWAYNNSAIQTLQAVLQRATEDEVTAFARESLFAPLGMSHTEMTTDQAGNAQTFEGVQSTCRDLARFGVLMLDRGRWGNRQIVSSRWTKEATGRSSTLMNAGYGYLWWLNRYGVLTGPLAPRTRQQALDPSTPRSQIVPGAPSDMYWALGTGNQLVQVDPGSETVVVRLGTTVVNPQPPTFGPAEASKVVTEAVIRKHGTRHR